MKNGRTFSILVVFAFCHICNSCNTLTDRLINTRHLEEPKNDLHKMLYQEILRENNGTNLIFSPFSIQLCLALAHAGASGVTADEISTAIGFSSSFNAKNITNTLETLKDTLHIANKIYVKSGFKLKPEYQTSVRDDLHSDVDTIDFLHKKAAANTINHWVEEQTEHKIKDLVKAESFDELTRLLLVNAIYFKALWKFPFPDSTKKTFTNLDSTSSDVEMMKVGSVFEVGRLNDLSTSVVRLPYVGGKVSMFVLIPDDVYGVTKIEQNLELLNHNEIYDDLKQTYIELELPKFGFELELKLNEILKKIGIVKAFDADADFSKMLMSTEPLQISDAIHKAFIKVNKKGTEAGAATVVEVAVPMSRTVKKLKADHPFMFAITSKEYNVPLFVGTVKHL